MIEIFTLLILFQIKHFVCDYPLQTRYMINKSNLKGWVIPLLSHAGVHAACTAFLTVFWVKPVGALGLALFDLCVHFTMDRIKASPNMLNRFKTTDLKFWWAYGLDQGVHHLTHYVIIAVIVF